MRILHLAAEIAPIAKVGGLADVVSGLCRAHLAAGHSVEVWLPKYASIKPCKEVMGVPVTFLEIPGHFTGPIYSGKDLATSYLLFCKAAVERLHAQGFPDILHLHDWHTAPAALLLEHNVPQVLTIHNYAYQGECTSHEVARIGIKRAGHVNLLKEGIAAVDAVTTVSPTYAKELLATEPLLHKVHFEGILNGLDSEVWDPHTDPYLPSHPKRTLRGQLGLPDEPRMLVAAITRLVPQKGPELLEAALVATLELGGQFVLLGSVPDEKTREQFHKLQKSYASNPHVHLSMEYNEPLAHLIYGACDLLVVPSIFEPCGLTQLIAMRYGAVPLVRHTGGLADTVHEGINGFTFGPPTREALREALGRAMACWKDQPHVWKRLRQHGMESDFSWKRSAEIYLKLYHALAAGARQKSPAMPHAESQGQ